MISVLLALSLVSLLFPPTILAERHITCGSENYGYNYCRVFTGGRVKLVHKLSDRSCVEGQTWGYDSQGVWVDKGCRADFLVDEGYGHGWGGGYDGGYNPRHDHDSSSHSDKDKKIGTAVGVVAGAALLGALLAGASKGDDGNATKQYDQRHQHVIPKWAIGTFQGYNPIYKSDVELTITPSGDAYVLAKGNRIHGEFDGNTLNIQGSRFNVEQGRNGFVTAELNNPRNQVHYIRIR
jgi:hypothetical protein